MEIKNISYLVDHGPRPLQQLPSDVTTGDRERGLCTFVIRGNPQSSMGGSVTTIAYLADRHDRTAVLRAFYRANPGFVEVKSFRYAQRLVGDHGREWQAAHREIADDYFDRSDNSRGGTQDCEDRDCPICGETIAYNGFPAHVTSECDAANG
jgi:hypothetical protein